MSKAIYVALAGLLAGQAAAAPKFTTVFPIPGFNDGANPLSALVKINGAYYGTTSSGGRPGPNAGAFGTIFKIDARHRRRNHPAYLHRHAGRRLARRHHRL